MGIARPLPEGVFARALVEPGKLWWGYLHHSQHKKYGSFITGYRAQPGSHRDTLELALPPGRYRVQRLRPRDGRVMREDRVQHEGVKLQLASPAYEKADITVILRTETAPSAGTSKLKP